LDIWDWSIVLAENGLVTSPLLTELTASIVSAYVADNAVPAVNLAELIATVHSAVVGLPRAQEAVIESLVPAVNPKRSVHADYIVCLEDGKRFKSLKRHLMSSYGLTPDEYRTKWDLPRDYPMVAPSYAAARSQLAKALGLGRKPAAKATSAVKPARTRKSA
jgi:predicted transcriptional regulator